MSAAHSGEAPSPAALDRRTAAARLSWVIGAHGLLRIAGGTSGILIGLYLAMLSNAGVQHFTPALIGTLSAVAFAAELFASIPMGLAADAFHSRWLMAGGAGAGALASILFAVSGSTTIFFLSRALEGIGAAAVVPALLAYLTDATDGRPKLRVRAMSYFELTLLAGLAFSGLLAAQLFRYLHAGAFAVVALVYIACALMLLAGASKKALRRTANPWSQLRDVLRLSSLQHLAPVWLIVNAVVGLWLGPTLPFLLTQHIATSQFLPGIFAADPLRVGWLLFAYAIVFGAGITGWSLILPQMALPKAMAITLSAMVPVCAGLFFLNHSANQTPAVRWLGGGITALLIMIESGFTPAALAWLAQALPVASGRGAAMGIYSVLLSVGAIAGSLLAGLLGEIASIDGLLLGTVLMAVAALFFLRWVPASSNPIGATP